MTPARWNKRRGKPVVQSRRKVMTESAPVKETGSEEADGEVFYDADSPNNKNGMEGVPDDIEQLQIDKTESVAPSEVEFDDFMEASSFGRRADGLKGKSKEEVLQLLANSITIPDKIDLDLLGLITKHRRENEEILHVGCDGLGTSYDESELRERLQQLRSQRSK